MEQEGAAKYAMRLMLEPALKGKFITRRQLMLALLVMCPEHGRLADLFEGCFRNGGDYIEGEEELAYEIRGALG